MSGLKNTFLNVFWGVRSKDREISYYFNIVILFNNFNINIVNDYTVSTSLICMLTNFSHK